MITAELPRPVRLHNPGDIDRVEGVTWEGQAPVPLDGRFVTFIDDPHGFRALVKTLESYVHVDGCKTYRDIVYRWAPRSENNTAAYLADVCARCHAQPDDAVDISDWATMFGLCSAIAVHEGDDVFLAKDVYAGMVLAGMTEPAAA